MATVSSISPLTLPVSGSDMDAEPITQQFTNILNFLNEASNIDQSNCDLTSADGLVGKSTAQTIAGSKTFSGTTTFSGATAHTGTVTVGVNDTGHDVKIYGATSGAFLEWDESADELEIRGGAGAPGKLLLSTAETTVVDGNKLGQIDFQAPLESSGTDSILVAASIWAEADDTFAADNDDADLVFAVGESETAAERMRLSWDGTNTGLTFTGGALTVTSGADINLTAVGDVNIPADVGVTFGNDAEKIEGDGTDLTISGNNIKLTATADVVVPANVGITFGTGEKIEGDSTDLTVTSGGAINLSATTDVVVPANVGVTFGTGEKIEGDSTDLTVTSGGAINLTATTDVVVPANVGITFGSGEKIEGDDTDLTVTSGGDINLSTGTGALSITAGDVTFYDDNNNADVTMKMGTGSAEALEIAVLNGGSNKTAEEVRFTSKTASGTGDHGKIAFYVDDAEIGTFDDGGLDLASGKSFTVAGSALSSGAALTGSTDNTITTVTGADAIQGEATLTYNGVWLGIHETANTNLSKGLTINQEAADDHIISLKSSDISHAITDKCEADTYGLFMKSHTTGGGLEISGLADTNADGTQALELSGYLGEAAETNDTTGSRGVVWITASVTEGTTSWENVASGGNAIVLASSTIARVVMKGDGTIHASDTSWATSLDDLPDAISGRSLTTQRAVESGGVLAGYQIHAPELVDAREARGIVTAAEKPGEGEIPGHRFLNLQKGVKFSWDMAFQNFCWLAHLIERHVPADEIKNFPMAAELQSGLRYLEKGRNNGSHL